ncbi:MAG TPA: hypothetical protein VEI02_04385 [Planctomycetota bacterium]|nr:hypothetical protein [Planctomycetota bacterium]
MVPNYEVQLKFIDGEVLKLVAADAPQFQAWVSVLSLPYKHLDTDAKALIGGSTPDPT